LEVQKGRIGNRTPLGKEEDYERKAIENRGFDSEGFGGFFVDFYDFSEAFSLEGTEIPNKQGLKPTL